MAYIGTSPSNGVRRRFVYEATASQTSFSGNDENGITLTYVDSLYLDVYQNGVKLKAGDDYTATTGTTVVLAVGASANDVVEMVAFDVFSVNDSVSAKDGGSFAGNIGMGGTLGVTGVPTFTGRSVHSGGITIANAGQIGSVGDADAMAISSGGVVTFSQKPVGTGMDLLQTVTASDDATVEVGSASLFTTTYRTYILYYSNLHVNTDNVSVHLRFGIGGSIKTDSNYDFTRQVLHDGNNTQTNQSGNGGTLLASALGQSRGADTGEQGSGYIMIYDPASTDNYKHINVFNTGDDLTSDTTMSILGGRYNNGQAALTAIQFFCSSGNITSGYFRLYGIA